MCTLLVEVYFGRYKVFHSLALLKDYQNVWSHEKQ